MIEFKNITSTYSENCGVFNLDFYVKDSELVFLMGPTGSGKSTVLNIINKKRSNIHKIERYGRRNEWIRTRI